MHRAVYARGAGSIITHPWNLRQSQVSKPFPKDIVKKTFQLTIEGKHRDRVLDATKHEIRQYIKRERRKLLPEGVDYWDFECKFGLSVDTASEVHVANITALINAAANDGASAFYLEMVAKPCVRKARVVDEHAN